MRAFASLLIAVGLVAGIAADDGVAGAHPVQIERAFYSSAVDGRLAARIYLPASYASDKRRYPVVYFLHGLPASSTAYRGSSFLADALAKTQRDAIIVAPQAARDGDSDPEYLDWGSARNWETALDRDLVNYVDSRFRTIRARGGRALLGLSAGGYGAMIVAIHNLDSFSVIESWSGYFHATDPSGLHSLNVGSAGRTRRASAHTYVRALKRATAQRPTLIAFYVGTADKRFRAENEQFDDELRKAGVPHVFKLYPGGHEQRVWTQHAAAWLSLALDHLAAPR